MGVRPGLRADFWLGQKFRKFSKPQKSKSAGIANRGNETLLWKWGMCSPAHALIGGGIMNDQINQTKKTFFFGFGKHTSRRPKFWTWSKIDLNFQTPKIQMSGDHKSRKRNPAMEVGDVFPRTCPDWWWYYEWPNSSNFKSIFSLVSENTPLEDPILDLVENWLKFSTTLY